METLKIIEIVKKYRTPLFIYDEQVISDNANALKKLSNNCDFFYSMKANPSSLVCKSLKKEGLGIEVASLKEMQDALLYGFSKENIFFTAPSKSVEELQKAIEYEIFSINIDNLQELHLLEELCEKLNRKVNVTFRIHQNLKSFKQSGVKMIGDDVQFGIEEKELISILKTKKFKYIQIIGVHTFIGSNNDNIELMKESWINLLNTSKEIEKIGYRQTFIGLGGGFSHDALINTKIDFNVLSINLEKFINENWEFLKTKRIMLESGGFLTNNAGYYITKVLYTKVRGDTHYVFIDGGSHHIKAESRFSQAFNKKREIEIIGDCNSNTMVKTTVVGKLCTPTDTLIYKQKLPNISPGNILIFPNSGAYALTSSRNSFLSHPYPLEMLLKKDTKELVCK